MTITARYTALAIGMIGLAAAAPLSSAVAADSVMRGALYPFHSNPTGTCPGLDWHVVVGADNSVTGMVAWDRMKHFASLSGNLSPDDSFRIEAAEVGGPIKATITGKVTPAHVTISINGTGTGCDGKTATINRAPPGSMVGGGDGG
jgi:hypothetical protein